MRTFIFNNINDINKANEEIFSNNTKILNCGNEANSKGDIVVDDDVWLIAADHLQ